jgi:hypothetical protein
LGPLTTYVVLADLFVKDRARIAFSLQKPYIIEEYGMPV